MAQKSKITSRPMTKALGTASILSMAIAGANMANAIQTDFGVDYQADVYTVDGDAYGTDNAPVNLANLLRLQADFKDETTGVSLHTSTQLMGNYWAGDSRFQAGGTGNAQYNSQGNENVTVDKAYVQVPIAGTLLRVGRQATSWSNCFLTCDDRRDRIGMVIPTSVGTVVTGYDRRTDPDPLDNTDNGDMVFLAYLTRLSGWNTGLNFVYFPGNSSDNPASGAYAQKNTWIFSPYINGSLTESMDLAFGTNIMGGNDRDPGSFGSGDHPVPGQDSTTGYSAYLALTGDAGAMDWGVQYVGAFDGGLMSRGYDTYFGVLNSDPESTANPTSLTAMGRGLGLEGYNEHLLAAKLGFDITPQFNLSGSVGYYMVENPFDANDPMDAAVAGGLGLQDDEDSSMLYDITATYAINDKVSTHLTWTMMSENEAMIQSAGFGSGGNSLIGGTAASEHADEDLVAINLGLDVKF